MGQRWTGKLIGGLIGFFLLGGPLGLILGVIIGHYVDKKQGGGRLPGSAVGGIMGFMFAGPLGAIAGIYLGKAFDQNKSTQRIEPKAVFQINLIAILSYMARVDGRVDEKEVRAILEMFRRMGYGPAQMGTIQQTLQFSLQQPIQLGEVCRNFTRATSYQERLMLLRMVYVVVMADGVVHPAEKKAIEEIVVYFQITVEDFRAIQGEFIKDVDDSKYYKVLGLNKGATKAEIKRAYRKLALSHHPDRVAHLGPEYAKIATEKFKDINEAYQKVLDS